MGPLLQNMQGAGNLSQEESTEVVTDRCSGMSLTQVAKKHEISRASVCRLMKDSGRIKKTDVPHVRNQEQVIPLAEGFNSQVVA